MKDKLITHTDLDGISCGLILMETRGLKRENIEYLDYSNVDDRFTEFIDNKEYKNYNKVYITDLSISDSVAKKIDKYTDNIILIDHHKTSLFLNKYNWCQVTTERYDQPTCATLLVSLAYPLSKTMNIFIENIRRWDTWDWTKVEDGYKAKDLNNLLYILGRDKFIDLCIYNEFDIDKIINDKFAKYIIEIDEENKKKYIEKKSKCGVEMKISIPLNNLWREYLVYVVCADKYISELGNTICKNNPEYDLCIMIDIDNKTLSYRNIKEDIDCSAIAEYFNGGGHPRSSGSKFGYVSHADIYSSIFDEIMSTYKGRYCNVYK